MATPFPLAKVIRRINSDELKMLDLQPDEQILSFDSRKDSVSAGVRRPLLRALLGGLRYYRIRTQEYADCEGPVCEIRLPDCRFRTPISLDYSICCPEGNEARMVRKLATGEHPSATLDGFLKAWMQEFIRNQTQDGVDLVNDFAQFERELKSELIQKARDFIGVELQPFITIGRKGELDKQAVNTGFFAVRVADAERDSLKLRIESEIQVAREKRLLACTHPRSPEQLSTALKKAVRQELAANVGLHEFCFGLAYEVRDKLLAAVNRHLSKIGRYASYLAVESPDPERLKPPSPKIQHVVFCQITDCDEGIEVRHSLLLRLRDLAHFRRTRIEDVEKWARKQLDLISEENLFDATYIKLLHGFGPPEIKREMRHRAEAIGYEIKQMIVMPQLEQLKWGTEGIHLEITDEYPTSESHIEVKIEFVIEGRIEDLRDDKLKPFLKPKSNITEEMERAVRHEARMFLHEQHPERCYMRFFRTSEVDETSVKEELEKRVAKKLHERFCMIGLTVIAKSMNTALTERLFSLAGKKHEVSITTNSFHTAGRSDPVEYSMIFSIRNVHPSRGWQTFVTANYRDADEESEAIDKMFVHVAKAVLDTLPEEYLQFRDIKTSHVISEIICENVAPKIVEAFGLQVQVHSVHRMQTQGELTQDAIRQQTLLQTRQTYTKALDEIGAAELDQLRLLHKAKKELLNGDGEPGELETIDKQIHSITKKLLPRAFSDVDREFKASLPPTSEDFNLSDYLKGSQRPLLSEPESEDESEEAIA